MAFFPTIYLLQPIFKTLVRLVVKMLSYMKNLANIVITSSNSLGDLYVLLGHSYRSHRKCTTLRATPFNLTVIH